MTFTINFDFSGNEQCLVLFPYTAINEDELTLAEGQIVTIVAKSVEHKVYYIITSLEI